MESGQWSMGVSRKARLYLPVDSSLPVLTSTKGQSSL